MLNQNHVNRKRVKRELIALHPHRYAHTKITHTHTHTHTHIYIYNISRICRNLSIHIARFSASESPRAYTNIPKNHHFSLVAGYSPEGMRDCACASIPNNHSLSARIAISCVHYGSRFISSLLAYSLLLIQLFCFCNSLIHP